LTSIPPCCSPSSQTISTRAGSACRSRYCRTCANRANRRRRHIVRRVGVGVGVGVGVVVGRRGRPHNSRARQNRGRGGVSSILARAATP
jgi:hypothetical protein